MSNLSGVVCLVTGATRGIGKGIAIALGKSCATVYITGRTLNPPSTGVGGSLKETAEEINDFGGKAIPVLVDHSNESEVTELFKQISREQNGRLDIVVNNAYSAVGFLSRNMGKHYYQFEDNSPGEVWDTINNVGLRNHYICSVRGTRLMLEYRKANPDYARPGVIINISSAGSKTYLFNAAYSVGKAALDAMTSFMSHELKKDGENIAVFSLWPGPVLTEEIAALKELPPAFARGVESPELSGKVTVALAKESADKLMARSGQIFLVCDLAEQYNITETDGRKISNMRSLRYVMRSMQFPFADYFPEFIRLPHSVFMWLLSNRR